MEKINGSKTSGIGLLFAKQLEKSAQHEVEVLTPNDVEMQLHNNTCESGIQNNIEEIKTPVQDSFKKEIVERRLKIEKLLQTEKVVSAETKTKVKAEKKSIRSLSNRIKKLKQAQFRNQKCRDKKRDKLRLLQEDPIVKERVGTLLRESRGRPRFEDSYENFHSAILSIVDSNTPNAEPRRRTEEVQCSLTVKFLHDELTKKGNGFENPKYQYIDPT